MYFIGDSHHPRVALGALTVAHGQEEDNESAVIAAEKHEIHLQRNVHRGHACASAVLVVPDSEPLDFVTRLAVLHARREGVHRFILLVRRTTANRADAVEYAARELLMTVGVDGDAVPAIQSALIGDRPPAHVVSNMHALLAVLDDLPSFLEPDPLHDTPPSLAHEGALLDAIHPLFAPAILFEHAPATLADTAALREGGGGSHVYGVPYLDRDEPLPRCERCGHWLGCTLQFDTRDVPHSLAGHGLFVVFECEHCRLSIVRHHPAASPERRRVGPWGETLRLRSEVTQLRPGQLIWQLPRYHAFDAEHPYLAARLRALTAKESSFNNIAWALGSDPSHSQHHGGYCAYPGETSCCSICGMPRELVFQTDAYVNNGSLWACREHPSSATFEPPH